MLFHYSCPDIFYREPREALCIFITLQDSVWSTPEIWNSTGAAKLRPVPPIRNMRPTERRPIFIWI